jgi:hypothetical protein
MRLWQLWLSLLRHNKAIFLKGECHEIFDLWFFHQTIPPGPLIHGLKPFCIWLRIREDIRLRNRQFLHQQCQWHRWCQKWSLYNPNIFCVNFTAMGSTICLCNFLLIFPLKASRILGPRHQRCQLHCWCDMILNQVRTSGVNDTAEAPTLSNNFANSKPYAKMLLPVNQGPRRDCLMKKKQRSKILWHCPFKVIVS